MYNEAGYGAKNDPLLQETLRAAPMEAPQEVKVFVNGKHSVRVTWRGVSTGIEEEPLVGYMVSLENRILSYVLSFAELSNSFLLLMCLYK